MSEVKQLETADPPSFRSKLLGMNPTSVEAFHTPAVWSTEQQFPVTFGGLVKVHVEALHDGARDEAEGWTDGGRGEEQAWKRG